MSEKNEADDDSAVEIMTEDEDGSNPSLRLDLKKNLIKSEPPEYSQTDGNDGQEMDMFASVWVKVEVADPEDNNENIINEQTKVDRPKSPVEKKSKKKEVKKRRNPKLFKCTDCDYSTKHKNCLVAHTYGHQDKKPFKCQFCSYASKYATALSRHVMVRHNAEQAQQLKKEGDVKPKPLKKYKCELCEYQTPYKWNLSSHKRTHKLKDTKRFQCDHCEYVTAFKHNIEKHHKTHEETIYTCDQCPFTTKHEGHITRHMIKIHNVEIADAKLYKCNYCEFGTKYNWRLTIHTNRMKRDVPFKCTHCAFETFFRCESKLHKKQHYPFNNQGGYTDAEIYNFVNEKSKQSVKVPNVNSQNGVHTDMINKSDQNTVNASENFSTNDQVLHNNGMLQNSSLEIGNGYSTSVNESVHSRIEYHPGHTSNYVIDPRGIDWNNIEVIETLDREKPFACTVCTYTAKFKASVQRHYQRLHTDDNHKPYRCTNCDFSTKTKDQIALHNKRSQSEISLICSICNFTTFYKCTFTTHQKTHYENKCIICNHVTKHKHEMQRHIALEHMGAGMKCQFCSFKSARKDALTIHEATHTGYKPLRCTLCDYSANRRSLLKNHYKRNHSDYINSLADRAGEAMQENHAELSTNSSSSGVNLVM